MAGMAKHNAGSRVEWASQAGGSSATKRGKVVEIVPAMKHVAGIGFMHGVNLGSIGSRNRVGAALAKHDRYLVAVSHINGVKLKQPAYYAPTVAVVDRQAAERKQAKKATAKKPRAILVRSGKLTSEGAAQAVEHASKATKGKGNFRPVKVGPKATPKKPAAKKATVTTKKAVAKGKAAA